MERDFQTELKTAQASVKALGTKREKLIGDARVEESKVTQATEALKGLGIADADKLTVDQLKKLREKSQSELETNLDTLKTQITAAETVVTEYEAVQA